MVFRRIYQFSLSLHVNLYPFELLIFYKTLTIKMTLHSWWFFGFYSPSLMCYLTEHILTPLALVFSAAHAWSSWSCHGYYVEVRSTEVKSWSFCFHHWLLSLEISTYGFASEMHHVRNCSFQSMLHWLWVIGNIFSSSIIRLETNWIVSIILCSIVISLF